jgi:hypothetical protein
MDLRRRRQLATRRARQTIPATIVSPLGPENAPSSDVFGHNRKRRSSHENTGCYFASGAAHDLGGRRVRLYSDQRSAGGAPDQLKALFRGRLGDQHAFGGSIPETDQRAGRRCGLSDCIAGLGDRDFPLGISADGQ